MRDFKETAAAALNPRRGRGTHSLGSRQTYKNATMCVVADKETTFCQSDVYWGINKAFAVYDRYGDELCIAGGWVRD